MAGPSSSDDLMDQLISFSTGMTMNEDLAMCRENTGWAFRLTSSGRWTLRIDMQDSYGNTVYAQYEDFQIGDAASL